MDTPTGFDGSGVAGRANAKAMLVAGVLLSLLDGFAFIAAPGFMGGGPSGAWTSALLIVGLSMPIVGLVWMVAIYRRAFDPEPDQHAWRYRADD